MFIKDGEFDIKEFKKKYKKMEWKKVPRQLGPAKDFFYIGTLKENNEEITIKIRPSMRMMITESSDGFDQHGKKLPDSYKGQTYKFGTTIEVLIDDKFLDNIKKICKDHKGEITQKVSW